MFLVLVHKKRNYSSSIKTGRFSSIENQSVVFIVIKKEVKKRKSLKRFKL